MREEGAQRLADTCCGLSHQGVAITGTAIHRFGQLALPTAKIGVGKAQRIQVGIAYFSVGFFLLCPDQKALTLLLEKLLQVGGTDHFDEGILGVGEHVEVNDGQLHLLQIQLLAEQPAVDLHLRPMQGPVIGWDAADIAPVGFDFFETIALRVIAISATTDEESGVASAEWQFGKVVRTTPAHHGLVTCDTFLSGG